MINSFLVSLVNSTTQPVNPSSTVGDIFWPENARVRVYTGDALAYEQRIFGASTGPDRLAKVVQLLLLVQTSTSASYIVRDDTRITYTQEQLIAQLSGYTATLVTELLATVPLDEPPSFLPGELRTKFRGALSPTDKLAAIVAFYGVQW